MTRWSADQLTEYMTKLEQTTDEPDPGPESNLQKKCMKYCREHGYPCFHDRSKKKNEPGWPDLMIFMPKGRVVLVELKAGSAKLRREQQALKLNLCYLGHGISVVRSFRRFLEIMKGGEDVNSNGMR